MIKKIVNTLIDFVETKLEIYKIQLKEEAAKAFTFIILIFILSMILLLFALFLSLFVGGILNKMLNSSYYGYLIISGFYLIAGILIYLFRKKIRDGIADSMYFDDEEN